MGDVIISWAHDRTDGPWHTVSDLSKQAPEALERPAAHRGRSGLAPGRGGPRRHPGQSIERLAGGADSGDSGGCSVRPRPALERRLEEDAHARGGGPLR